MATSTNDEPNPLNMWELETGGPFVLPTLACTKRRREFVERGNQILAFYYTTVAFADLGQQTLDLKEKENVITNSTTFEMGSSETTLILNYGQLKKQRELAKTQLTNQAFVMVYGNFEAYISDLVLDGFSEAGAGDPQKDTTNLMIATRWPGKISKITQKLKVSLGTRLLKDKFSDYAMGFLGQEFDDPIEFLDKFSDFRIRIIHSGARVDSTLKAKYPTANFTLGDLIRLPFDTPNGCYLFTIKLTDVIDEAFSSRFGWNRNSIQPEKLTL